MRVLASTFRQGDLDKILQAMRSLPYDRLLLIGTEDVEGCDDLAKIRRLEEMAGHEVEVSVTNDLDFMGAVDHVTEALANCAEPRSKGQRNSVMLNISGGTKLLGDAALLAAFRLGVEAYHVDGRITRLPVIRGATATDRFTKGQRRFLRAVGTGSIPIDQIARKMEPMSRQAVDRVIRELKRDGLVSAYADSGKVIIALTPSGLEVLRAIELTGAD